MGGNVSNRLRPSSPRAMTAIRPMPTVLFRQRHSKITHETSQIRMALAVTPESARLVYRNETVLDGCQLVAGAGKHRQSERAIPAARMAAAPEPFVRTGALGEAALFGMFIFLLPGSVESCDRPEPAHTC